MVNALHDSLVLDEVRCILLSMKLSEEQLSSELESQRKSKSATALYWEPLGSIASETQAVSAAARYPRPTETPPPRPTETPPPRRGTRACEKRRLLVGATVRTIPRAAGAPPQPRASPPPLPPQSPTRPLPIPHGLYQNQAVAAGGGGRWRPGRQPMQLSPVGFNGSDYPVRPDRTCICMYPQHTAGAVISYTASCGHPAE